MTIYCCPSSSRHSQTDHPFNDIPESDVYDSFDGFDVLSKVEDNRKSYGDKHYSQLLVIDDCSSSLKQNESYLIHLLLNRRHNNLSVFICSQYLVHVPLSIRTNIDYVVALRLSGKELEKLREEFSQLSREQWRQLIQFVWGNKKGRSHEYLAIHHDNDLYFKGMQQIDIK